MVYLFILFYTPLLFCMKSQTEKIDSGWVDVSDEKKPNRILILLDRKLKLAQEELGLAKGVIKEQTEAISEWEGINKEQEKLIKDYCETINFQNSLINSYQNYSMKIKEMKL